MPPKALIYKGFCKRSITELHGFRYYIIALSGYNVKPE
jgi:hypothetical protein